MQIHIEQLRFIGNDRSDAVEGLRGRENPLEATRPMLSDHLDEEQPRAHIAKIASCKEQLKGISGRYPKMGYFSTSLGCIGKRKSEDSAEMVRSYGLKMGRMSPPISGERSENSPPTPLALHEEALGPSILVDRHHRVRAVMWLHLPYSCRTGGRVSSTAGKRV